MRYLGLDLGTKTLGVAISDKTNTLVSPLKLIKFKNNDYNNAIKELMPIINEYNIEEIVLGLPKNMDGTEGFAAKRSIDFKHLLEKEGLTIHLEDERLTTVSAVNILKESGIKNIKAHEKTDIISAIIILESFIKRKNNGK